MGDVRDLEASTRKLVAEAGGAVKAQVTAWKEELVDAIAHADFTPSDYDPPPYPGGSSLSQEEKQQAQDSEVPLCMSL